MNKLMIMTVCAAVAAASARAEEFGEKVGALSESQEALKRDGQIQDAAKTETKASSTASAALEAWASQQEGWKLGVWDEKNQHIIVLASSEFSHSTGELDEQYFNLRRITMTKLLLRAKSAIVEKMAGDVSHSRVRGVDPELGEKAALTRNEISRAASLKLLGCSVVKQAENVYKDGANYKVEIAILYSWSKDAEALALNMMSPESAPLTAQKKDGKKTVRQWLRARADAGDLVNWCGPRRYVDGDGNAWFLGISSVPRFANSRKNDRMHGVNETRADGEVALSIYADAWMEAVLNEVIREFDIDGEQDLPDDKLTQCETSFVEKMGERVSHLQLPGRGTLFDDRLTIKDDAGNEHFVSVVVRGVCAAEARKFRTLRQHAKRVAEEADAAQEKERQKIAAGDDKEVVRPIRAADGEKSRNGSRENKRTGKAVQSIRIDSDDE